MAKRTLDISIRPKRESIPLQVRCRMRNEPCAICRAIGDITIDHITPVCRGGSSKPWNLQPLCYACNARKGWRNSNSDVLAWVRSRGRDHYSNHYFMAKYRLAIQDYTEPPMEQWVADNHKWLSAETDRCIQEREVIYA
jgi:hypothetical protein